MANSRSLNSIIIVLFAMICCISCITQPHINQPQQPPSFKVSEDHSFLFAFKDTIINPKTGRTSKIETSFGPDNLPTTITLDGHVFTYPKTIKDLNSELNVKYYDVTNNDSASLNALGFVGFNLSANDRLIIMEFVQKKIFRDTSRLRVDYGVALYAALHIKNISGNLNLSIEKIAAACELGQAEVTFQIKTIGLTGTGILKNIPTSGTLNVKALSDWYQCLGTFKSIGSDTSIKITPQKLPIAFDLGAATVSSSLKK